MATQRFISSKTKQTDGRTDGQTDGQTDCNFMLDKEGNKLQKREREKGGDESPAVPNCRVLKAHCGFSSPIANLSYNSNFSTPSKSSRTTSSSWLLSKVRKKIFHPCVSK
ncbi:hypothetical protein ACLKA6_016862 [Drosophila palustris]